VTSGLKSEEKTGLRKLESWKHIASYLNCNERTAKRWEATRNLPIRRLPGARGGVFAMIHEIEAWQMGLSETAEAQPLSSVDEDIDDATPVSGKESSTVTVETPVIPAGPVYDLKVAGYHWQISHWQMLVGAVVVLLLVAGLSRFHPSALASRREVAVHVPSPAARELDLKGRFYWNKRTPQDLKVALETFQKAVAMDPEYADAYAGLAECYGLSTEYAALSVERAYPPMLAAAQKAVALDPNLATAHRALGFALFYWNWDRAAADRELQRAIALNPNDATTHHWYANILLASQRYPEALQEVEKARELDPGAPSILADRGLAFSFSGRIVEAKQDWLQLEKSDPAYLPPHWYLAEHYLHVNEVTSYMAELKAIAAISGSTDDVARANLAQAAFTRGKEAAVVNELADFNARLYDQRRIPAMKVAFAMAGAGRNQEALAYIRHAFEDRDQDFLILPDRTKFPALLDSPEYQLLVAKSRLPYPQTAQFAAAAIPAFRD
jgi:tetratricopeptide (TPR) repeat protein